MNRTRSLSVQLFLDVLRSLLAAAAVFALIFGAGTYVLNETIYSAAFTDRMTAYQCGKLQEYVEAEQLTPENLRPLDIWCSQGDAVYLTIYLDGELLYESPLFSRETGEPEAYDPSMEDPEQEFTLIFSDGTAGRAFLYYYVSDIQFEGASLQPASGHYIGRYSAMDPDITGEQSHWNKADEVYSRPSYKATGTQKVATYLSMQNAYDVTHKRNDGVTMVDSRTYGGLLWEEVSYVQLMYLVEYANLNSQDTLGAGGSGYTSGDSDDMPYHTGVIGIKTKENSHVQYRYVEGLLGRDNSCNIVENLLVDDYVMYIAPSEGSLAVAAKSGIFSNSGSGAAPSDWVAIGTMPSSGWITGMNYDETLPLVKPYARIMIQRHKIYIFSRPIQLIDQNVDEKCPLCPENFGDFCAFFLRPVPVR